MSVPSLGRRLLGRLVGLLRRLAGRLIGRSAGELVANDALVSRLSVARFAARWAPDGAMIELGCLDALPEEEPAADLIVAIYSLQQLAAPDRALDWSVRHLRPGGHLLVAVPPVVDEGTMEQHRAIPGHKTHRFVWEWELRLRDRFARVERFRHLAPEGAALDFSSPLASTWRPEDFRFVPISPAEIDEGGSLGLVLVAGA